MTRPTMEQRSKAAIERSWERLYDGLKETMAQRDALLKALEAVVAELGEIGERENEADSKALTNARAAIAKARGQ